jgi:hypothetical protein
MILGFFDDGPVTSSLHPVKAKAAEEKPEIFKNLRLPIYYS